MSIAKPEDTPSVNAASREFIKLCYTHGLVPEQIIQASIVVATTGIVEEVEGDLEYALDLVSRAHATLRSAVSNAMQDEKGTE